MVGNATIDACRKLRKQIIAAVAATWEVPEDRIHMALGEVVDLHDVAKKMSTREAFQLAEAKFDTLGATGAYNTPELGGKYRGGTIGASPAYSFTAHVAEVSVDVETGRIHLEKIWCAHDCGRALNPTLVAGQIEGSVYMGAAEAIMEHHYVDQRGLHACPSLLDYPIPTSMDTPDIQSWIVESIDPEGPYGAKEAGEGPLHSTIPAIANAVYDAIGIRLRHLPFTPARVLAAIREQAAEVEKRRTREVAAE
jgi:CO/xanthine dehydrogenase Mo-binding subunit